MQGKGNTSRSSFLDFASFGADELDLSFDGLFMRKGSLDRSRGGAEFDLQTNSNPIPHHISHKLSHLPYH